MNAATGGSSISATLRAFAASLLQAGGFAPDHAAQTADLLVWANLRGADSHGVLRIPRYVEMVELGMINPKAEPRLVSEFGATAVLDADRAPGAVGMTMAAEKAVALARSQRHRLVLGPDHHPCRRDRLLRSTGRPGRA